MVKGNHSIPCYQFKKDVHPLFKTWLNQPARKQRRRLARQKKVAAAGLAPINKLRPIVQCCSQKYNFRPRAGRGFTVEELKAVGLTAARARTIGISSDVRRVNKNQEGFDRNVERLKEYMSKLVVFPRKASKPRPAANGVPADTLQADVKDKKFTYKIDNKIRFNRSVVVN
ncbi:60S ribosomal protein L13 [Gregarina niphandrodes]|uniref:60S ribosomal protein L13 n=1 Tax=Gregarina niphandrodes TaxID=110365 RepID=A0A023AWV0_GRENI|nr:60S ribosomal protein L13 [Gregarina niphandrodes]EZG42715.1 60S ribosomal protein L13 [Gregarina niphandrodes]|eukprot:XP_011134730.1 60S ribosomal protein L13 [Gregarina niphandrodes]